MNKVIGNAISPNMVPLNEGETYRWTIEVLSIEGFKKALGEDFLSIIGHASTACLLTALLGIKVTCPEGRVTFNWTNEVLFVAQYSGPRLPEGATSLPEGATIKWLRITKS